MNKQQRYDEDVDFKAVNDIYSLYFIGWLIGALTFVIGAIWAEVKWRNATTGICSSHFHFQRIMAWRGIAFIAIATGIALAWQVIFDGAWLSLIMTFEVVFYIWWWLSRCMAGYRIIAAQEAIADPTTWARPQPEIARQGERR